MKPKLLAFYFPQFHSIPENESWWGENFTDWKLVRTAKQLFVGHYQPREPLNDDYYDLNNPDVIKNQSKLAKDNCIDGFVFYHYWFDGKMLLNTPVDNLRVDSTIDIEYCLSWANSSWTRQWVGSNEILIGQKHKKDHSLWANHFKYLLDHFLDKRYLKINGKPVFIIYSPDILRNTSELFAFWDILAKENGLPGIYYIATKGIDFYNYDFLNSYDALLKFQPREANTSKKGNVKNHIIKYIRILPETIVHILSNINRKKGGFSKIDSLKIWEYILENISKHKYNNINNIKIYESAFFNWDNTARYRENATIYTELTRYQKRELFDLFYKKCLDSNTEYIFFNAWNEWSEAAYLEPDKIYGNENLDIIRQVVKSNNR